MKLFQLTLQLSVHIQLIGIAAISIYVFVCYEHQSLPVVFHEGPELLQSIQLTRLEVLQSLRLEISVQVWSELLLQTITVESEQALETISRVVLLTGVEMTMLSITCILM